MSLKSKLGLILFLSLFSFSTFVQCQQTSCDLDNRPQRTSCYEDKPLELVCAYYIEDCPFEVCGKGSYNPCEACSDPKTVYYEPGECKPEIVVQSCEDFQCQGDALFQNPLCGYKKENGQTLSQTFLTYCELCNGTSAYQYYQQGACEKDKYYCEAGKNYDEKDPVCALFNTENFGLVYSTISNISKACSDPSVEFFLKGECALLRDSRTYCLPNVRPETCAEEDNPVCGFYFAENGGFAHRVVESACKACLDPAVSYHTPGPCVFYCDLALIPDIVIDCSWEKRLVCGTYVEGGNERKMSFQNGCIACYASMEKVVSYVDGLCPGDLDTFPNYEEAYYAEEVDVVRSGP